LLKPTFESLTVQLTK